MSNLLIDEPPLQVLPGLALAIGLNEALVLQQLHYWLKQNRHKEVCQRDGRVWCFASYVTWWKDQFPFWGLNTVVRTFNSLEALHLVLSANYNRKGYDRTKWYTIDYPKVSHLPILGKSSTQIGVMDLPSLGRPIQETKEETTEESKPGFAKSTQQEQHQQQTGEPTVGIKEVLQHHNVVNGKKQPSATMVSNSLASLWKNVMSQVTGKFYGNMTGQEKGQLKKIADQIGPDTNKVIRWCLENWGTWAFEAKVQGGLTSVPNSPSVGFLLVHAKLALATWQKHAQGTYTAPEGSPAEEFEKPPKPKLSKPAPTGKIVKHKTSKALILAELAKG